MPSSVLQGILEAILQPIFEVGGYYVGRAVVPLLSLGRLRCEDLMADSPRSQLRWRNLYYRRGSRVYLTAEATAAAGIVVVLVIAAGAIAVVVSSQSPQGARPLR